MSGLLTVVALVLLVLAGLQQDYGYVYAAIAATIVGAGLIAVTTYQRRGELTLDGQDEPRPEDEGALVGARHAAGELDGRPWQPAAPAAGALAGPDSPVRPAPDVRSGQLAGAPAQPVAAAPADRTTDLAGLPPTAGAPQGPHGADPAEDDEALAHEQVPGDELRVDEALGDEVDVAADEPVADEVAGEEALEDEAYREAVAYEAAVDEDEDEDEAYREAVAYEAAVDEGEAAGGGGARGDLEASDAPQQEVLQDGGGKPVLPERPALAPLPSERLTGPATATANDDPQVEIEVGGSVHVVAGTHRYHAGTCRYLTGKTASAVLLQEAEAAGLAPCAVCQSARAQQRPAASNGPPEGDQRPEAESPEAAPQAQRPGEESPEDAPRRQRRQESGAAPATALTSSIAPSTSGAAAAGPTGAGVSEVAAESLPRGQSSTSAFGEPLGELTPVADTGAAADPQVEPWSSPTARPVDAPPTSSVPPSGDEQVAGGRHPAGLVEQLPEPLVDPLGPVATPPPPLDLAPDAARAAPVEDTAAGRTRGTSRGTSAAAKAPRKRAPRKRAQEAPPQDSLAVSPPRTAVRRVTAVNPLVPRGPLAPVVRTAPGTASPLRRPAKAPRTTASTASTGSTGSTGSTASGRAASEKLMPRTHVTGGLPAAASPVPGAPTRALRTTAARSAAARVAAARSAAATTDAATPGPPAGATSRRAPRKSSPAAGFTPVPPSRPAAAAPAGTATSAGGRPGTDTATALAQTGVRAPARTPAKSPARTPTRTAAKTPARAPANVPARTSPETPDTTPVGTAGTTPAKAASRTSARPAAGSAARTAGRTAPDVSAATPAATPAAGALPSRPARTLADAATEPRASARTRSAAAGAASTAPAAFGPAGAPGGSVVVVPDRTKYHLDGCRFVRGVAGAQVVPRAAAAGRGYAPCGVCKP